MSINYDALTAWSALAAALVAIAALLIESRRHRFAAGVELLMKLDERFNTEMREARRNAARGLTSGMPVESDDVLDFFETIGMLVRRGALSEHLVWHTFFPWINGYWHAAQSYIADSRAKDPSVWRDFSRLHARLVALEVRERHCQSDDVLPSEPQTRQFLDDEASLE